jgi:hypothetical protein
LQIAKLALGKKVPTPEVLPNNNGELPNNGFYMGVRLETLGY